MKPLAFWTIPPMWAGKTIAILASGETMTRRVVEMVREAGLPTIAINTTITLAPWATMLYAADGRWWEVNEAIARRFHGLKVCPDDQRPPLPDLLFLRDTGKTGFDPDPSSIRTGGNGAYAAIHIAAHAKAAKVLLCGVDMRGGHWHGPHPYPLRNAGEGIYQRWLPRFDTITEELKLRGVRVLNCSPGSALKCFESMSLEKALEEETTSASVDA